ncbi:MAG: 23S rRNA (uracil(1939)-C(5))-methyltransferase RlmD [Lachnospiraceae bacterium]|nr:23S rRNA (uracil(1939)-C(5))-methyltransferase RlmD [Lachnospiraceae bacterium]
MKTKPPVIKNEDYVMTITDIGSEGQGVGKIDGFTIFVPEALPDEEIEVKITKVNKSFAFGRMMKIIKTSPFRVQSACELAKRCGGCSLQHMSYEAQLKFKTKRVKDAMERIGGFSDVTVLDTIGMENPYNYRNKAQFPVGKGKDGVEIGFYAKRSHNIVDCNSCIIQHSINDKIIVIVRKYIEENQVPVYNEETGKGLIRHVVTRVGFATGEIMVCIVANGAKLPNTEELINELQKIESMTSIVLNVNREHTNVILGNKIKLLWGKEFINDYIGDIKFEISPFSFFQVNPVQTKVLYQKAINLAGLTGDENVLDIYCGIGTISLFLAQKAKNVMGVEIIPEAIADARKNAEINGINNVEFRVGSAEDIIPIIQKEGFKPDVVVVDPPRKGCEEAVLQAIVEMKPQKLVYVSCEPSTFARDLKFLAGNGYEIGIVQPIDQFCHSNHVEAIILMTYCVDKTKNEG